MVHLHGSRPLLLGSLPSDLQAGALWPWNSCICLSWARELCNSAWALLPLFLKQHIHSRYSERTEIPQISDLHSQVHNTTQSFCRSWFFYLTKQTKDFSNKQNMKEWRGVQMLKQIIGGEPEVQCENKQNLMYKPCFSKFLAVNRR